MPVLLVANAMISADATGAVGRPCSRGCYPGGMAKTQKVSVALEKNVLVAARKTAAARGMSLSGLLMKLLTAHFERQARFESMDRFIARHAPNVRVTDAAMQAIRDEMTAPLKPIRRRGGRRAA